MVDLAAWEDDPQHTAEIFLDRDPEIFAMVLRLMRQAPHVGGLVPYDPQICASVIAEADFLGFDGLLEHVKHKAYYNSREAEQDYPERDQFASITQLEGETILSAGRRRREACKAWSDEVGAIEKKFEEKDEAYAVERFDQVYGSIGDALSSGVLPKYFLEMKPLVPPPSKKIIQLVPTDAKMWFLVGDSNDGVYADGDGEGDEMMSIGEMIEQKVGAVRRVAFHALVENQNGHRAVEPMIHLTVEDTETLREEYYEYNLEDLTGDACRRTMLASDWFDKAVVRLRGPLLGRNSFEYWTHVLEAEEEPEENGFENEYE